MRALALAHEISAVNLGHVGLIPIGEGRSFMVGDVEVAVFRARGEEVFATQARCPHRGGPLADGTVGGAVVQCPLHGFKFDLETGKPVDNDCSALETLRVDVSPAGEVILYVPTDASKNLRRHR
jgi:nitrite reductase (NADH) small subunit